MLSEEAAKGSATAASPVVVAIDPNFDAFVSAACHYREQFVYPYLISKGFAVDRYRGKDATRASVAAGGNHSDAVYITGVGHGGDDIFWGQYYDPIYEVGAYDPTESTGKIVHFLSCYNALGLGPDFVDNGCRAYFSYDDFFVLALVDTLDIYFYECDSEIDLAFADGLTAAQVYDRVKALFEQRVAELRATNSNANWIAAGRLESNLAYLRCPTSPAVANSPYGDPNATL